MYNTNLENIQRDITSVGSHNKYNIAPITSILLTTDVISQFFLKSCGLINKYLIHTRKHHKNHFLYKLPS